MSAAAPPQPAVLDPARVLTARNGVGLVFAANGFLFANWVARLPAVRDNLQITPGQLGLVLLALSAGSVSGLPLSGLVVQRLRPARTVLLGAVAVAVALAAAGSAPTVLVLVPALFVMGAGTGIWDVAMNVEAAEVERRLGRAIMPRFHAGFSMGTVAGALTGAVAAGLHVSVAVHLLVVSVVGLVVAALCVRVFLPVVPVQPSEEAAAGVAEESGPRWGLAQAWREPRTLGIGLFVLGMAFAEGSANDWLAIGLVDDYGVSHAVGAAGFGVFVTAMTLARLAGTVLLDRHGRVATLRVSALLVLAGVATFIAGAWLRDATGAGPALALAAVGALAWGAGAALGFPVGMSAASDDPAGAAVRVSVVSTIGYTAFIAGPPVLGLLGDRVGVANALVAVCAAVGLSLLAVGSVRPPRQVATQSAVPAHVDRD